MSGSAWRKSQLAPPLMRKICEPQRALSRKRLTARASTARTIWVLGQSAARRSGIPMSVARFLRYLIPHRNVLVQRGHHG
jgi:hypothetical protein